MKKIDELLEGLKEMLTVKLDTKEETKLEEKVKLEQMAMPDGAILEAESFEAGQPIFIVTEDGNIPLPVGDYELETMTIVVAEEGVISEVKAVEAAAEEELETEFVTVADFNKAIDDIKALLSKETELSKDVKTEKEVKLEEANKDLQKKIDNMPDAKAVVTAPIKKEVKMATSKQGRITQGLQNILN